MPRPLIRPWPGEHIVAGLVFDTRMSKFKAGHIDSGSWRVAWCRVELEPLPVPFIVNAGQLVMQVARMLRKGDLCTPAKLAIEAVREHVVTP